MNESVLNPTEMREDRSSLFGLTLIGILCAVSIVLAIIGLARVSLIIAAVTMILLSIVFLLEGGSMIMQFFRLSREKSESGLRTFELGEGINAEFMAGISGLILGILALLNVVPITLISVAVIVYGLALATGVAFILPFVEDRYAADVNKERVKASSAIQVLIGITGVILGILALVSYRPVILNLVAVILLSLGTFLTETTLTNRVSRAFVHKTRTV